MARMIHFAALLPIVSIINKESYKHPFPPPTKTWNEKQSSFRSSWQCSKNHIFILHRIMLCILYVVFYCLWSYCIAVYSIKLCDRTPSSIFYDIRWDVIYFTLTYLHCSQFWFPSRYATFDWNTLCNSSSVVPKQSKMYGVNRGIPWTCSIPSASPWNISRSGLLGSYTSII